MKLGKRKGSLGGLFFFMALTLALAGVSFAQESRRDAVREKPAVAEVAQKLRLALLGRMKAPEFVLRRVTGEEVRLSDYRGRVVLLNFWTTW